MAELIPVVKFREFDDNGDPLAGGKVYTYEAGTTTPKATYTDSGAGTPNANPVILDAEGRADIWLDGAYKILLKDADDVTIYTVDNVQSAADITVESLGLRERLAANRNYYVANTGSNSNDGLTVGTPFLTIQKAVDVYFTEIDPAGYTVTVLVDDGTDTGGINITSPTPYDTDSNNGALIIQGNLTTPANCIISTTGSTIPIAARSGGAVIYIGGFKLTNSGTASLVAAANNSLIQINGLMDFGACGGSHISAIRGSTVNIAANYNITAAAVKHINVESNSMVNYTSASTVTITGTPAFSTAFASVSNSRLDVTNATYSGSATGIRYALDNAATVRGATSSTFFPGDASGTMTAGCAYNNDTINALPTVTIDNTADYIAFYDASGATIGKTLARVVGSNVTSAQSTPSDPTGTTSATQVMMGLAGSITPTTSGKIMVVISGGINNSNGNTASTIQIRYGTGSAPTNGAAATGTTAGAAHITSNASGGVSQSFSVNAIVSSLTPATAYWLDLGVATAAGTASIKTISISAYEI